VRETVTAFLMEPLRGKTSLSKVFWLYGVLGSVLYGALEVLVDPGNVAATRIYIIGGFLFSVYVTLATYQCAVNCRSLWLARFVRVSAILTLLLLPVLTYLDLIGALTLTLPAMGGD
jgi:hypothetical protein